MAEERDSKNRRTGGKHMARQAIARKTAAARPRSSGEKGGSDQVQSLVRALSLLNRIAESPDDGATLTDLAQQVGLPPSTAHRLLLTLEQERYVRFSHDRRIWTVGVQAFVSGCAFIETRNLAALARPHMRRLMEESGETVNLAIEDQDEAVYLAQVECRQMMRVFARPGTRVLLHCSAVGKAMLAALPANEAEHILNQFELPQRTPHTITDVGQLMQQLTEVAERGYAVDDEEDPEGVAGIGACVLDRNGRPAGAISVTSLKRRDWAARKEEIAAKVIQCARRISGQLSGRTNAHAPNGVEQALTA
jgi:IclR family acetate operon transcriptional repressor